jgi:hypothetical protein
VSPGARLSLQMHYHRAEHWVVVSGTARVTREMNNFCSGRTSRPSSRLGYATVLRIPAAYRFRSSRFSREPILAKTISSDLTTSMVGAANQPERTSACFQGTAMRLVNGLLARLFDVAMILAGAFVAWRIRFDSRIFKMRRYGARPS